MPFNPSETILDNLLARTKAEIDRLRKLLQADVKSNLSKAAMAAEVADYIWHEGEFWIRRFPQRDIRIIRGILSQQRGSSGFNAGLIPYPTALEKLGLVYFECNPAGETIYRCSDEMYDAFKCGLPNASAAMHCMNYATYEQYLLGLTNIYGIAPYPMAYDTIIDAADLIETEPFDRQRNHFAFAHETLLLDLYTVVVDGKVYVHSPAVRNPEELVREQQSRFGTALRGHKKFSLPEIFSSGAGNDGYPFVPSAARPGNTLPGMIDTLFAPPVSSSRLSGPALESSHTELAPASTSLASYIKFALWHSIEDYDSPHKHLVLDLIYSSPLFKSDPNLKWDFEKTLKDFEENIPIWNRLGYSYKEYYLKFGQPDISSLKPAANFGTIDITTLRRKKPKK